MGNLETVADEDIGMTPAQKMAEGLHEVFRQRVKEGVLAGYERAMDDRTNVPRSELMEEIVDAVMERLGYISVEFSEATHEFATQRAEILNTLRLTLSEREAYLSNLNDVQERCSQLVEENRLLRRKD